jgi:hypothetical protein
MLIPLKDGSEYEVPNEFFRELNLVYYGVDAELGKMRVWCLANPDRRKTKRGVKRFIANWVSRACVIRPVARSSVRTDIPSEPASSKESRLAYLAELKAVLK